MIPLLIDNLKKSVSFLENGGPSHKFALDIYWHILHKSHKWYIFKPKMGIQSESYSDIENKKVNYKN